MNKKNKLYLFEVESPNLCILIFVLSENIPDSEVLMLSENTEYVEVYNKIHQYVVVEKHFLDKDITVNTIMRHCNVKKNSLNKILRQNDDRAFHGYINKQRVIYASTLLLDPSNKLIEVVALEACFNNASSG